MKAIIEIPAGSTHKYELKDGKLILDRIVPLPYPDNYGFIPGTLAADGDPEDIFVIAMEPIVPGATIDVVVTHNIRCLDNGVQDDKLIGYINGANLDSDYYTFAIQQIKEFLTKYKPGFEVIE